tara:strand:+ start:180 stop:377 length:198 start_codon:yes stop_codon:yes gene_type:complete
MDKKISEIVSLSNKEFGLITNRSLSDDLPIASTTKQEQDPAIIAKQLDDWLFEEYEETSTEVSSP